jgi:hypothetical protein
MSQGKKKPQHVWSGRPVGTHGHPHTAVNERLHRHEYGVSFFVQSQDEQDRAAFMLKWEISNVGITDMKRMYNFWEGFKSNDKLERLHDISQQARFNIRWT